MLDTEQLTVTVLIEEIDGSLTFEPCNKAIKSKLFHTMGECRFTIPARYQIKFRRNHKFPKKVKINTEDFNRFVNENA